MSDQTKSGLSRRTLIKGSLALGAVGGVAWLRPEDKGASTHNEYFQAMSQALKQNGVAKPSLVVDKTVMANNIQTLTRHLKDRFDYRIVAKSLPSIQMLKWTMAQAKTQKLMVFHQPFLSEVAKYIPSADVLMGKPMPIAAVKTFYEQLGQGNTQFNPSQQLQWLVDSSVRLKQYSMYAQQQKRSLQINIELDVGLHRGGVNSDDELVAMLNMIEQNPNLSLSGFMGYEPHIGKVPGDPIAQRDEAMATYSHYISLAEATLNRSVRDLTLNAAGSPTYQYYNEESAEHWPMNELSSGSCLVKPSDFDLPTLTDHKAAAFIASPVLKVLEQTEIPGVSFLGDLMAMWNQNWQKTFFAYGGYWKANPVSPQGLTLNPVYGRSSNQEMYNGSATVQLQQDDFIFLRPTQSESVLLQFGDILVYENGQLKYTWPVMQG
ncbi:MAG: alanine racemase [Gammaproteobacteria bacterium]|nr:alanine racemase [Gammaproteobacteria bacterium]